MFGKKRPWKKYARIIRRELNNGDVQFTTEIDEDGNINVHPHLNEKRGTFEDIASAEAALDAWWAGWWPNQVKSRRPV